MIVDKNEKHLLSFEPLKNKQRRESSLLVCSVGRRKCYKMVWQISLLKIMYRKNGEISTWFLWINLVLLSFYNFDSSRKKQQLILFCYFYSFYYLQPIWYKYWPKTFKGQCDVGCVGKWYQRNISCIVTSAFSMKKYVLISFVYSISCIGTLSG